MPLKERVMVNVVVNVLGGKVVTIPNSHKTLASVNAAMK